jgi:hypothetical protein
MKGKNTRARACMSKFAADARLSSILPSHPPAPRLSHGRTHSCTPLAPPSPGTTWLSASLLTTRPMLSTPREHTDVRKSLDLGALRGGAQATGAGKEAPSPLRDPARGPVPAPISHPSPRHGFGTVKGRVKKAKVGCEASRAPPPIWDGSLSARDWHPAGTGDLERRRVTHSLPADPFSTIRPVSPEQAPPTAKPRQVLLNGSGNGRLVIHLPKVMPYTRGLSSM